jgi:hypothetical protein
MENAEQQKGDAMLFVDVPREGEPFSDVDLVVLAQDEVLEIMFVEDSWWERDWWKSFKMADFAQFLILELGVARLLRRIH